LEVEYVSASRDTEATPINEEFAKQFEGVFKHFLPPEKMFVETEHEVKDENGASENPEENQGAEEMVEDSSDPKPTKKERKHLKRLKVAVLKQLVSRPDVVDIHDVNASDPLLLVYLKSYRNTVPIPKHWCQKKKYLQGKRGFEKSVFQLPENIAATGVAKVRAAYAEKDAHKKLKSKQREKMLPKMHKMDIDYQILHDAFFKYQIKPKFTGFGDLYHENKEFEVKLRNKKPGELSEELKRALGMPAGAPPPWLINMQRYGPPPSYPNLKIPGLNAPIPPGAQFGYHPGGWGKPPVDELGRPLYGDVFGTAQPEPPPEISQPIDRKRWGEIEPEEEEEEESSENEEEQKPEEPVDESGLASVATGIETPDVIDVRKPIKAKEEKEKEEKEKEPEQPKQLYQVIKETAVSVGGSVYGSAHKYIIPGVSDKKESDEADTDFTKALEKETKDKETEEKEKKKKEKEKAKEKSKKYDFKF